MLNPDQTVFKSCGILLIPGRTSPSTDVDRTHVRLRSSLLRARVGRKDCVVEFV
jgi:hypothetical protein